MSNVIADSIEFCGHRCFKKEWSGFETIRPVNVIIGRNNTGKSHMLDLVAALCENKLGGRGWRYRCGGTLEEQSLRRVFQENVSSLPLDGNHWANHGRKFASKRVCWETDLNLNISNIQFSPDFKIDSPYGEASTKERISMLGAVLKDFKHHLGGKIFRRLLADRDVRPESAADKLRCNENGEGFSNIIRKYITTSNIQYPRELIQRDVLAALNEIFGQDGEFTEIQIKSHDEDNGAGSRGTWEVYLGEAGKGLVQLSNSGSGLKTVLLVLLNLLVIPALEKKARSEFVFGFEELENNLHPALLRRLLQYVERYVVRENCCVFITTHSSTALDLFGLSEHAQITHVVHDGEAAKTVQVNAHFDKLGVISELGAKPSDLLQANGIIWVEGPSDCIYLNRWLDLYSEGRLKEGRDYQCAFYGGSLLARTQFVPPEEAEADLINLFRVNPNIIVVCDGDRSGPNVRVKDRVRRIRAEVLNIPGAHIWVTSAREIENYIPGDVAAKASGLATLPDPEQHEIFTPRKGAPNASFVESRMNRRSFDKVEFAILSASHMNRENMKVRFDWASQMKLIVARIDAWNS